MTTSVTNSLALARTRLAQAQGYVLPQNEDGKGNVIINGSGNSIFINPPQKPENPAIINPVTENSETENLEVKNPSEEADYQNQQIDPKQIMAILFQTIMGLLQSFGQLLGLNKNEETIGEVVSDTKVTDNKKQFNDLIPWLNETA